MTIAAAEDPDQPGVDEAAFVVPLQSTSTTRAVGFERIYATHYRDVYRYVLSLTRSVEESEDICADTFERALRAWSDAPERPVAWLLLTARRLATDRWRRAGRLARLLGSSQSNRPSAAASFDADFDIWFASIAAVLTDRQREVLVLRYQRDLTDLEIGSVMGLSESGVRSLVLRALAVLRSHPELL